MKDEDKKNQALKTIDESSVRARQVWKHNKTNNTYTIIAVGLAEPNYEPVVAYSGHDGIVWMRTLAIFLGNHEDGMVRFTNLSVEVAA